MVPKLSSVLAELVYELAKTVKEESCPQSSSSLSVRIKTYQSASSDGQQLLCHLKVSSGWRFPVAELLTEQKLSELARFLLHVQRESEDCHCVLVKNEPTLTSPDTHKRVLTSSVSLTVTQDQRDGEDPCPCGGSHGSEFPTEASLWERGDSCGGLTREGNGGKSCTQCCRRRKIVVTSTSLGEASGDAATPEKEGAHLHIRFSAKKVYILEEGKLIHDFLHHLKLFHPTMKLSFVLNIDELMTRASYRFQGMATIQGQSVITDPKYFSKKSSLSSESFWGCGERVVVRGPRRSARALCLACHVTHCQSLWSAAAGPHCQGLLSIHVYGPYGVPSLKTDTAGLLDPLATEVSWQQFGLKLIPASSCDKEEKKGQARLALMKERRLLPVWAGHHPFVLSLHLLCLPADHDTPIDHFQEAEQLVEDVLKRNTGAGSGDGGGGGGGDVCGVITAALMDLYQHPTTDSLQQQTCSGSHLDRLLPLISKSVAEIYSRSHNQHFRDCMQLMTQVDSGHVMECTLRQDLYAIMTNPVPRGAQSAPRHPPASAQQGVTETCSPPQSSSAQRSPCRLLTPGLSAETSQGLRNHKPHRKYEGALSVIVEEQVEVPLIGAKVMDSQAAEKMDMTSVEEEDWFSQMEQELTL